MLRPLFFVTLVLVTSPTQATAPAPAATHAHSQTYQVIAPPLPPAQAPADEYFGRYKLSSLSVRTAIYDMTVEGDSPLALPLQVGRIAAVESALPEWADKYPHDPWLPSAMIKFSTFLMTKQEAEYDRAAFALLSYLKWVYPQTWYARYAERKLEDFDMHPNIDMLMGPTVGQLARVSDNYFTARIRRHAL